MVSSIVLKTRTWGTLFGIGPVAACILLEGDIYSAQVKEGRIDAVLSEPVCREKS